MKTNHKIPAITLFITCIFLLSCATKDVITVHIEVDEGTQLKFDISPDGSQMVFDLLGQLWTIPFEGGKATPITNAVTDTANDTDPIYSPDGSFIVFSSDRPEGIGLYTLNLTDANIFKVTDGKDTDPAFSSDGNKLAFVRRGKLGIYDFVEKTESFPAIDSTPTPFVSSPFWMPDEKCLMFVCAGEFWIVSDEGGVATPVVENNLKGISPCASPAGDKALTLQPSLESAQHIKSMLDRIVKRSSIR